MPLPIALKPAAMPWPIFFGAHMMPLPTALAPETNLLSSAATAGLIEATAAVKEIQQATKIADLDFMFCFLW